MGAPSIVDKIVALAGGQTSLADLLDISPQAVQAWVARGQVPLRRAKQIEDALAGKVTRKDMFPDLFS